MNKLLRAHADAIVASSIHAVKPDAAVCRALAGKEFPGRVVLVAAGKAGWQMAKAAHDCLGDRIDAGVVVTKYEHVMGPIANFDCREAGHPVPDENSFSGTQAALDLVKDLSEMEDQGIKTEGAIKTFLPIPSIYFHRLLHTLNQCKTCDQ